MHKCMYAQRKGKRRSRFGRSKASTPVVPASHNRANSSIHIVDLKLNVNLTLEAVLIPPDNRICAPQLIRSIYVILRKRRIVSSIAGERGDGMAPLIHHRPFTY
eukprot:6193965-Pleurochrysis_carterae.AAC.1